MLLILVIIRHGVDGERRKTDSFHKHFMEYAQESAATDEFTPKKKTYQEDAEYRGERR